MPHLIIESTQPLSSNVVEKLHETVGAQETVSIEAVKTRMYSPMISLLADAKNEPHVALTLKLMPGRSPELKETMAANLFSEAQSLIPESSLSVEVVELGVYKK